MAIAGAIAATAACQNEEPDRSGATTRNPASITMPATTSANSPPPAAAVLPAAPAAPESAPPASVAARDAAIRFFRVQGVVPGDVLNVRRHPDAKALVLASIAPDSAQLEGIGAESLAGATRWQRVRYRGTIGWVNARFLAPAGGEPPAPGPPAPAALLAPLICFGTEPFWNIRFGADGSASCGAMCEGPPGLRLSSLRASAAGEPESFDLLTADGRIYLRAALRQTGECSDGMSDFVYPYEFGGVGTPGDLSGCCRRADEEPRERQH